MTLLSRVTFPRKMCSGVTRENFVEWSPEESPPIHGMDRFPLPFFCPHVCGFEETIMPSSSESEPEVDVFGRMESERIR